MSSKPSPSSCFAYVTLPGQTEPVTAARVAVEPLLQHQHQLRQVFGHLEPSLQRAAAWQPKLRLL